MHESEKWKWRRSVCPTLSDPMDRSLPGSSVHGIFQAKVLEWGAIAFSPLEHCLQLNRSPSRWGVALPAHRWCLTNPEVQRPNPSHRRIQLQGFSVIKQSLSPATDTSLPSFSLPSPAFFPSLLEKSTHWTNLCNELCSDAREPSQRHYLNLMHQLFKHLYSW